MTVMPHRLTILSVAYPFAPVGVDSVGGAEQILASIDGAIVGAGHRSIVIAHEASRLQGRLVPIPGGGGRLDAAHVGRVHAEVTGAIARVLAHDRVDVLHMHGLDFDRYLPMAGPAVLATLHLPIAWYAREALSPARHDVFLCCVSKSQHDGLPSWAAPSRVIENGIRVGAFRISKKKRGFVLSLGRICPEKALHEAIDAAQKAGVPLVLAGEVAGWDTHRRYFESEIVPRLSLHHRFIGPVGLARKRRLVSRARCLLVPSRAPETSSLVAMEALASGTPVIAYRSGALSQIVEEGTTGFLVDDVDTMALAIEKTAELSPRVCRSIAETRFSERTMTDKYLSLYEELARSRLGRRSRRASVALAVEEIHGSAALTAIGEEWAKLWARSPSATPFQRPEWLLAYARTFACPDSGAEPWALLVRREDELLALAPFCTRGGPGGETISLLGDGTSDYLDIVVATHELEGATSRIFDELAARSAQGTTVVLDGLRSGSPLLARAPLSGIRDEAFWREPSPVLSLAATADPIPPAMRTRLRDSRRRAERMGEVVFEDSQVEGVGPWLERLFQLHGARWRCRGEEGVLAQARVQSFHRQAVPALAAAGFARIHGLRIGDKHVAAMLVLCDERAAYYYIGGFDPAFAALSPGALLIGHAIDCARTSGAAEVDFLRGSEPYKYRFGAEDRKTQGRRLTSIRASSDKMLSKHPLVIAQSPGLGRGR